MKDLGKTPPQSASHKTTGKRKPPTCKYHRYKSVKSRSIFEYKTQNASEIASEIVHADLINHGYRLVKTLGEGAYAKVKLAEVMPSRLARNQILADLADDGEIQVCELYYWQMIYYKYRGWGVKSIIFSCFKNVNLYLSPCLHMYGFF